MTYSDLGEKLLPYVDNIITGLTDSDGEEIAYVFRTLPDKKIPGYYDLITNPISLNQVKIGLKKNRYNLPNEFVKDLAQIVWNAKMFNRRGSLIYKYAELLEKFIKTKVMRGISKNKKFEEFKEPLVYPDLGVLPKNEDDEEEEGKNSEQSDEDENNENNSTIDENDTEVPNEDISVEEKVHVDNVVLNNSVPQVPENHMMIRLPVNASNYIIGTTPIVKRRTPLMIPSNRLATNLNFDAWCKRGKPPTIDRPHEQRIKNVLRLMKRIINDKREYIYYDFEKPMDKKNNMSLEVLRSKVRQKEYSNISEFVNDLAIMIHNFKTSNSPGSDIYKNTVIFEKESNKLVIQESEKPDSAYLTTDSNKIPLDFVEFNGKKYRVGDWVLLRNPNSVATPIVGQIFRTWKTNDSQQLINVCWYYRPEQTVHRIDRLFYENEVCKSGQYRDHRAEDLLGKCYVAYFTRYQRGDPGVIYEGPLFLCEFRYSDIDKQFKKIRTWKGCLPDEVRNLEDPIIPLSSLRIVPKVESPLRHLLSPNSTERSPIPDPVIGDENAPPLYGGVYIRPPDSEDDLGQYSSSVRMNKNNIPKNLNNLKNITDVALPPESIGKLKMKNLVKKRGSQQAEPIVGNPAIDNQSHMVHMVSKDDIVESSRSIRHSSSSPFPHNSAFASSLMTQNPSQNNALLTQPSSDQSYINRIPTPVFDNSFLNASSIVEKQNLQTNSQVLTPVQSGFMDQQFTYTISDEIEAKLGNLLKSLGSAVTGTSKSTNSVGDDHAKDENISESENSSSDSLNEQEEDSEEENDDENNVEEEKIENEMELKKHNDDVSLKNELVPASNTNVWYKTPPIYTPFKIQCSSLLSYDAVYKRTIEDGAMNIKRAKISNSDSDFSKTNSESIHDEKITTSHSSSYISWLIKKNGAM